jgi:hypothetical protein
MTTFYCLRFETPPTWRVRSPYFYPPGTGWPGYTPTHWVLFRRLLRIAGLQWRYSTPPPYGIPPYHRHKLLYLVYRLFFNLHSGGVESELVPLGTSATHWPIVPAPGDCEDGEFGEKNDRGNRSTRRKPAPTPLCPPHVPLDQTRD